MAGLLPARAPRAAAKATPNAAAALDASEALTPTAGVPAVDGAPAHRDDETPLPGEAMTALVKRLRHESATVPVQGVFEPQQSETGADGDRVAPLVPLAEPTWIEAGTPIWSSLASLVAAVQVAADHGEGLLVWSPGYVRQTLRLADGVLLASASVTVSREARGGGQHLAQLAEAISAHGARLRLDSQKTSHALGDAVTVLQEAAEALQAHVPLPCPAWVQALLPTTRAAWTFWVGAGAALPMDHFAAPGCDAPLQHTFWASARTLADRTRCATKFATLDRVRTEPWIAMRRGDADTWMTIGHEDWVIEAILPTHGAGLLWSRAMRLAHASRSPSSSD